MYNIIYFVEVEHRDTNVKIVNFFLKTHKHSKNKYCLKLKPEQKVTIINFKIGKK